MNPHARINNPHESSEPDYEPAVNEILAQDDVATDVREFGWWLGAQAKDNVCEQLAEIIRLYKNGSIPEAGVLRAFLAAYEESRRVRAEQTVIDAS